MDSQFKPYRRTSITQLRPYVPGEDLTNVRVSHLDDPETDRGMIARSPEDHSYQWYVSRAYFEENFEPIEQIYGPYIINSTFELNDHGKRT